MTTGLGSMIRVDDVLHEGRPWQQLQIQIAFDPTRPMCSCAQRSTPDNDGFNQEVLRKQYRSDGGEWKRISKEEKIGAATGANRTDHRFVSTIGHYAPKPSASTL